MSARERRRAKFAAAGWLAVLLATLGGYLARILNDQHNRRRAAPDRS